MSAKHTPVVGHIYRENRNLYRDNPDTLSRDLVPASENKRTVKVLEVAAKIKVETLTDIVGRSVSRTETMTLATFARHYVPTDISKATGEA